MVAGRDEKDLPFPLFGGEKMEIAVLLGVLVFFAACYGLIAGLERLRE
jgi:hypothetical protein